MNVSKFLIVTECSMAPHIIASLSESVTPREQTGSLEPLHERGKTP